MKRYPFSEDVATEAAKRFNVDLHAMHDRNSFESVRVLRTDSFATSDYQESRLNIIVDLDDVIVDIFRG